MITVHINGQPVEVPVKAWLGMRAGKIVTWYANRRIGDRAIQLRTVDATMPAENYRSRSVTLAREEATK